MKHFVALTVLVLTFLGFVMPTVYAQDGGNVTYVQVQTSDGNLTFAMPEDWIADTETVPLGSFLLTNNQSVIEKAPGDLMNSGEFSMVLSVLDVETAAENGIAGETVADRLAVITAALETRYAERVVINEIEFTEADDVTPATAQVSYVLDNEAFGTLIFWDVNEDLMGTAILSYADGEWEDFAPIVTNIYQSVRYIGDLEFPIPEDQIKLPPGEKK